MKLQKKLLVALLAVGFTAGAANVHASMALSNTGDGSLFLSVFNGSNKSAIFDLGQTISTFLPAAQSAAGTKLTWNLAGNANYSQAWADYAAATPVMGASRFDVAAMDSLSPIRYLSTSSSTLATIKTQSTSALGGFSQVDTYVNISNLNGTHPTVADGGSVSVTLTGDDFFVNGKGDNWKGKAPFVSTAAIDTDNPFYMLTPGSSALAKAVVTPYGSTNGTTFTPGVFNLSNTGMLTYSVAPSAVPIPAAAWLLGSGLIGLVGVARRRSPQA